MTGFLDLPRRLRERIYREVLVRKGITSYTDFRNDCKPRSYEEHYAPALLRVSAKIDREAAPHYFGGNHFKSNEFWVLWNFWRRLPPRDVRLVGRLTVVFDSSRSIPERPTLERITSMVKARKITVIVDE